MTSSGPGGLRSQLGSFMAGRNELKEEAPQALKLDTTKEKNRALGASKSSRCRRPRMCARRTRRSAPPRCRSSRDEVAVAADEVAVGDDEEDGCAGLRLGQVLR